MCTVRTRRLFFFYPGKTEPPNGRRGKTKLNQNRNDVPTEKRFREKLIDLVSRTRIEMCIRPGNGVGTARGTGVSIERYGLENKQK